MNDPLSAGNINLTIARGAGVNILGAVGKLATPIFFIAITRLYGPDVMGVFFMAYAMITIVASLAVSGLNDAVLLFVSKAYEEEPEKRDRAVYQVLANGFIVSLAISMALILFANLGGVQLILSRYPQAGVVEAVQYLVFSLPFYVIPVICISATKALIIMRWEAIIQGFLLPMLLLAFAVGFYLITPTLNGLLHAYMAAGIVTTAFSLAVFRRYFSIGRLLRQISCFRLDKKLIFFAIPQNLNMTFNASIGNLDVVMLGYFAFEPSSVGFYAMGSQLVRNIRQIKLAFSGIYSPIIARLSQRNDAAGISLSFSTVSRWASTAALPIAFLTAIYRDELIRLFHPSFTSDTGFMLLLLIPPLLSCALGLSGNIIVMTGHSIWNLTNSITVTGATAWLGFMLIPKFGLEGAACAAAAGAIIGSGLQLIEAHLLAGATIWVGHIYKPFVAILPAAAIVVWYEHLAGLDRVAAKAGLAATGVGLFILLVWLLKLEEDDKRTFFFWIHRKSRSATARMIALGSNVISSGGRSKTRLSWPKIWFMR
jgi:O-antigen/teichoic acid export membrane protein